ncbi:CbtB-domain containing protein [Halomicroarcula sp. F13]|uniref:CbtB-domain containing protein n=1 Tax=Haloarcula rubra TaxID=2487747 RepID=A0AAW4PSZ5_9EURY|nr:CbtB domain-containing protein [Halomicroarcula rubra]MBX0324244.1 CbtB-domain containing protein [Halomicroarcula rubra]
MQATDDSVSNRIERARASLTGTQVAVALALVAALGFTLLFVQDPMLHDSLHNFRHSAGITCH